MTSSFSSLNVRLKLLTAKHQSVQVAESQTVTKPAHIIAEHFVIELPCVVISANADAKIL